MFLEDYHVHTEFSDDSTCPMENQVEKAIEIGLKEICFTDHVDYGIKYDYDEMDKIYYRVKGEPTANVVYPLYFKKLDYMRQLHGDKITIKNGLEFGMQTHTVDKFQKLYDRYQDKLDFVLLSCHQINDLEFWNQDFQKGKSQKEYNERYYKEIYDVMRMYHDYSVLAHLDVILRYDEQGFYPFEKVETFVAEILKQAIKDGKGIEVNTSSYYYKLPDLQPSRKILHLYKDLGGKIITVGSDAHKSEYLALHNREAINVLKDEIGFTEICTFDKMQPSFHKI